MAFITKMRWNKPAVADAASRLSFWAPIWQHKKPQHRKKKLDLRSYNVTLQNLLLYINNTDISSCSFARLQSYFLKAESHCTYILMQQGRFFTDFSAQYRALRPHTEIHIWATLGYGNNTYECGKIISSYHTLSSNHIRHVFHAFGFC